MRRKMEWISVEDRLPDPGVHVLVVNSHGGFIWESFINARGKWDLGGSRMIFTIPTHWMHLLELPK